MKRILEESKPKFDTNSVPNTKPEIKQKTMDDQSPLNALDIYIIGATLLVQLARKPEHTIFAVTMANIKKALILKKNTDPAIKVPVEYYKYLKLFL